MVLGGRVLGYVYVTNPQDLGAIAVEIEGAEAIALDLETANPAGGPSSDPFTGRIRIVSINTGRRNYVIDLYHVRDLGPVSGALRSTKAVVVGQNLKYDQKWLLWHYGIEFSNVFDTYRASNLLYAGLKEKHDLWSIYKRELRELPRTPDLSASDWNAPTLSRDQLDYAADDTDRLLRLRAVLKKRIIQEGLAKVASIEFQAVLPESVIELNGLRLDQQLWLERTKRDEARARALAALLVRELPNPVRQGAFSFVSSEFNLDSNEQMLTSLRMLGVKQRVQLEAGGSRVLPLQDTTESTMAMLADKWPILHKVIEYRGYSKNVSAFGAGFLKNIHQKTGRVHCSYHPYTDSGRYACRQPNLQQIPRSEEFRSCFRVEDGRALAISDWSNIEMRLAAEISGDKKLIEVFNNDRDAHRATASIMTGKPEDKVTKEERQQGKPVNFGFIYGMSAGTLVTYAKQSYGVDMTLAQAKAFRDAFFRGYSGIASWHRFALEVGPRRKETRTLLGRRRLIPFQYARNEFLNSPVQGSGADGLKRALRCVYENLKRLNNGRSPLLAKGALASMVHMVHDEILVEHIETPEVTEAAQKALQNGMVRGMDGILKKVKCVAEVGGGKDWSAK
jgi:DNA polymerase-1